MQSTKLNIINHEKINQFISALKRNKTGIWIDKFGDYKVFIGENIIKHILGKNNEYKLFAAENLTEHVNKLIRINENSEKFLSVGSFKVHNTARKLATIQNKELITIPVPISNDSFGTNRYNNNNSSSVEGIFPTITIFDLEIIQMIDIKTNILGVGEFIGLYYSILDYSYCYKVELHNILKDIKKMFFKICKISSNNDEFLINISISLVYKCLIMRVNEDHSIGCGIDHLFANVFEKEYNLPHGKAVYWGALVSSVIIPDWDKHGINTNYLIENGLRINILNIKDLLTLSTIDIHLIIKKAIKSRPNRKTILLDIDKSTVNKLWYNFKKGALWVI